jgi:hypothetical protein
MSKLIKKDLTTTTNDDSINNNNNNNKVTKVKFCIGKTPSNDSLNSIQNENDSLLNGNGKNTSPDSSDDSRSNGLFR